MPFLPEALASVAAQTYRDFELVVQDAESSDDSLNVVRSVKDIPRVDVVSEPDTGIGDAYNRAVNRCRGAIVGSIDADNIFEPDALEQAVGFLEVRRTLAAAYGGSNMMDIDGGLLYPWMPGEPDLLRLLTCELVPPFAVSFFNREVCGADLWIDAALRTCADFDLWLRLSHLPIARIPRVLGGTRLSPASMTRRPETYNQYIVDKTTAVENYLAQLAASPVVDAVRAHALAGIHLWSAESVYDIEARRTPQFERYLGRALELDPGSPRAAAAAALPSEKRPSGQFEGPPLVARARSKLAPFLRR